MAIHEDHAFGALRANPGKWHCLPCWAQAARITSPTDLDNLSRLARTKIDGQSEYERAELSEVPCDVRRRGCDSEHDQSGHPRHEPGWGLVARYPLA